MRDRWSLDPIYRGQVTIRRYGSANRFGACLPPNTLGKGSATKHGPKSGPTGGEPPSPARRSPPLGLQSKLGKIPAAAETRLLRLSGGRYPLPRLVVSRCGWIDRLSGLM